MTLGIMRSSNENVLGSLVQSWKPLKAIQKSWDFEGIIVQEDGGFEDKSGAFRIEAP